MRLYVEENRKVMKIVEAILKRLKEKSTWAGVGTILALVGLKLEPEQFTAISTAVIGVIGLYEVFRKEKK
jgi:uncharacterized membrane protein